MSIDRSPPGEPGRLDAALVRRGLARSRGHAAEIIKSGRAFVNEHPAKKPATVISGDDLITLVESRHDGDVSRAAEKLRGALDVLEIDVDGLRCVDVGASTGGFTQVLLERGAEKVVAIDVGTGQLVDSLRRDRRVQSLEGTHVAQLVPGAVPAAPLVVADLSFVSLRVVLEHLAKLTAPTGILLPMVKPQFEVGRSGLNKHGVVTEQRLRREAVLAVIQAAAEIGFGARAIHRSGVPGPAGNEEFFVALSRDAALVDGAALWERHCDGEHLAR